VSVYFIVPSSSLFGLCLSRAAGCLSELSCGGIFSLCVYVCVCVCVCVHVHHVFTYPYACVCVRVGVCVCVCVLCVRVCVSEGSGRQLAEAFFPVHPPWGAPTPAVIDALLLLTVQRPEHRDPLRLMFICGQKPPRSGGPVVKHLNPHQHSSGSDFLLRKDTST